MNPPDNVPLLPSGFVTTTSKVRLFFGPLDGVVTTACIDVVLTTVTLFTDGAEPCPLVKLNDAP